MQEILPVPSEEEVTKLTKEQIEEVTEDFVEWLWNHEPEIKFTKEQIEEIPEWIKK